MLKRAHKHKTEENPMIMMRMLGLVYTDKAAPSGEHCQDQLMRRMVDQPLVLLKPDFDTDPNEEEIAKNNW
jgi:hypothetical protein